MVKCFYKGRNGVTSLGDCQSAKEFFDMRESLALAVGLGVRRLLDGSVMRVYDEDEMLGEYYTEDA
jgi:hypothetical protein